MKIISLSVIIACFSIITSVSADTEIKSADERKTLSADQILDEVDRNLTFETRTARMTMTVEGRRTRVYEMISYSRGEEDTAIEYLSPARERGTRMLKLDDEVWLYMPSVDRVQKISGHMMRQGMMGSDVSYEDLMTSRELRASYRAELLGEEVLEGRKTWKIEMIAKDDTVSYPRRLTWIDQESFIPLKQELYALSGMLLKTWTMSNLKKFEGGRVFPSKMTIEDHVRRGSSTRIEFMEQSFGIELEDEVFSLRWLERR